LFGIARWGGLLQAGSYFRLVIALRWGGFLLRSCGDRPRWGGLLLSLGDRPAAGADSYVRLVFSPAGAGDHYIVILIFTLPVCEHQETRNCD
jgi:hypothetical protein